RLRADDGHVVCIGFTEGGRVGDGVGSAITQINLANLRIAAIGNVEEGVVGSNVGAQQVAADVPWRKQLPAGDVVALNGCASRGIDEVARRVIDNVVDAGNR